MVRLMRVGAELTARALVALSCDRARRVFGSSMSYTVRIDWTRHAAHAIKRAPAHSAPTGWHLSERSRRGALFFWSDGKGSRSTFIGGQTRPTLSDTERGSIQHLRRGLLSVHSTAERTAT